MVSRRYVDMKFAGLDAKMDGLNARMDGLDAKIDGLDKKYDGLSMKMDAVLALIPILTQQYNMLIREYQKTNEYMEWFKKRLEDNGFGFGQPLDKKPE